jgi:hypothetical protein
LEKIWQRAVSEDAVVLKYLAFQKPDILSPALVDAPLLLALGRRERLAGAVGVVPDAPGRASAARLRLSFPGPVPPALPGGVVVKLRLLGHLLHHGCEIGALAFGAFGPFGGHFQLLGERLILLQQRRELPMVAHRRAWLGLGVAKLAAVRRKTEEQWGKD